jgi:hypothetical protein
MTKRKRTNNDLQNITHKTKDGVTRTPLYTGYNPNFELNSVDIAGIQALYGE